MIWLLFKCKLIMRVRLVVNETHFTYHLVRLSHQSHICANRFLFAGPWLTVTKIPIFFGHWFVKMDYQSK